MDGVRHRYPRDREPPIVYALSLIALAQANATDTTFSYQKRADAILEPLFKAEPRHPGLAHYLIHTNDAPRLARLGLYAARHYAEIAPDVPHRSEEHTSELQSHSDLVCRLLLEKKKTKKKKQIKT